MSHVYTFLNTSFKALARHKNCKLLLKNQDGMWQEFPSTHTHTKTLPILIYLYINGGRETGITLGGKLTQLKRKEPCSSLAKSKGWNLERIREVDRGQDYPDTEVLWQPKEAMIAKLKSLIICVHIKSHFSWSLVNKGGSINDPCSSHSHPARRREGTKGPMHVFWQGIVRESFISSQLNQYIHFLRQDWWIFHPIENHDRWTAFIPLCILKLHLHSLSK